MSESLFWCGAAHMLLVLVITKSLDIIHRQFQCFFLSLMSYRYLHIIKSQSGTQSEF